MTRLQRLLAVLAIANGATTWWVFSTAGQARDARSEYLAYLNRTFGTPLGDHALTSREAMWVNSTAAWEANALRWTLIGYVVTAVVLVVVWIMRGRPRRRAATSSI